MPESKIRVKKARNKAAGTDGQVQYNNGGKLGGSNIDYNDGTEKTTMPNDVILKAGMKLIFDG